MGAVVVQARSVLRRRWPAMVALAVLLGLGTGAVLAALAGARRTASSFTRLLAETNAADVLVSPDDGTADFDLITRLPQVSDAARVDTLRVTPVVPNRTTQRASGALALGSDGRAFYEIDRPARVDGRLPDLNAADEVLLSRPVADRLGLRTGDEMDLLTPGGEHDPPRRIPVTVVGVGVLAREALEDQDNLSAGSSIIFSPAFRRVHGVEVAATSTLVQLRTGRASLASFESAARGVTGEQLFFQTRFETTAKAQRTLVPYVGALSVFGIVLAVAVALMLGQAVVRELGATAGERATLASLGVEHRQLVAVTVIQTATMAVPAALVALVVALAASPLMPIGPAGDIDPQRGFDADLAVLGLGSAGLVALLLAGGAAVGWRLGRTATAPVLSRRSNGTRVPLAERLRRTGAPLPMTAGVRFAIEPAPGSATTPAVAAIASAVLGLAAVVAALTFAAGLDRLLATPERYGWNWDALLDVDLAGSDEVGERLDDVEGVGQHAAIAHGQLDFGTLAVAAVGIGRPGGQPFVPILEGRAPEATDEVVLGTTTLERLDLDVGDEVVVATVRTPHRLQVVGRATFPRFTAYPGADRTGLGDGAALTLNGLRSLEPRTRVTSRLVRFAGDAEPAAVLEALGREFPPADGPGRRTVVARPQRPDDLYAFDRVNGAPLVLAALLGLLAAASTALALTGTVRARRRELSVLRAIGFTGGQVRRAVRWQAATVALAAILVGVPVGTAAGRWAWTLLAMRLGTPPDPLTPGPAVAGAALASVAVALAVSWRPARSASTSTPAAALRVE